MTMKSGKAMYFSMVCEEMEVTGGKTIHINENVGSEEEVHNLFWENVYKYPNAKWEIYPSGIIYPLRTKI